MKGFGSATEVSWHYTDARQLLPLIKSKALKPTMGYSHRGERPVVWFTRADTYEPMAYPAWLDENGIRRVMASEQDIARRANGLLISSANHSPSRSAPPAAARPQALQTIQILMARAASRLGDAINKLKINDVGRKAPPRRSDQGQRPMRGRVQQSTAVATAQE